jgi:type 1 fimbria pilin
MKPIIKNSLALMLLLLPVTEVMAKKDVECKTIAPTKQLHVNVGGAVFLGPDAPIGKVLYQSYVDASAYNYNYQCHADYSRGDEYDFVMREASKMLSISGSIVTGAGIPDAVYKTNVPGIGVRFFIAQNFNRPIIAGQTLDISGDVVRHLAKDVYGGLDVKYWGKPYLSFSLIKIGPITPGNVNFTARNQTIISFPNERLDRVKAPQFPYTFFDTYITASINVTSSSCKTSDYTVELGKHKLSELPAKGSTTNWINSDIILTNCPAFRGYYSGYRGNILSTEKNQTFPDRSPNEIKVRIKPANPTISTYPGTFAINNTPAAATGVGIQLSFGSTGEDFVSFNTLKTFSQPPSERAGNVTIPLRARYIRVDDRISAGRADGAATFMIEYY